MQFIGVYQNGSKIFFRNFYLPKSLNNFRLKMGINLETLQFTIVFQDVDGNGCNVFLKSMSPLSHGR